MAHLSLKRTFLGTNVSGCLGGHRWFPLLLVLLALALARLEGSAAQQLQRQQQVAQGLNKQQLNQQQQAAPFFSIKGGKTSARRIQQQQDWRLQPQTSPAVTTVPELQAFSNVSSLATSVNGSTASEETTESSSSQKQQQNEDTSFGSNSIADGSTRLAVDFSAAPSLPSSDSTSSTLASSPEQSPSSSSVTNAPQSGSSPTVSSMSMSLDGMIMNSRPRAEQMKAQQNENRQVTLSSASLKRSRGNNNSGSSSNNLSVARLGEQSQLVALPEAKASRRVPFSGTQFTSPATKGLRTKPTASNQQQQMSVTNQVTSNTPSPGLSSSSLFGPQAGDLISSLQQKRVASSSSGQSNSRQQPFSMSGFDEEGQQVRLNLNQLAQTLTDSNVLEPANLELMRNMIAVTTSDQQQQQQLGSSSPDDMLMSVMSSTDGKERRLVMIARDTLDNLQRFAAQEMQSEQQAQLAQKQQVASAKSRQSGAGFGNNFNRLPMKQQDEQQQELNTNNWSTSDPQANSWSSTSTFTPSVSLSTQQQLSTELAEQPVQLQVQQQQVGTTLLPFSPPSSTQQVTTTTVASASTSADKEEAAVVGSSRAANEQQVTNSVSTEGSIRQQQIANQTDQSNSTKTDNSDSNTFREVPVTTPSESTFESPALTTTTSSTSTPGGFIQKRPTTAAHNGGQQTTATATTLPASVKGQPNKTNGQQKISSISASSSGQQEAANLTKQSSLKQQQSGSRNSQSQSQQNSQGVVGQTAGSGKASGKTVRKNNGRAGSAGSSGSSSSNELGNASSSPRMDAGKQTTLGAPITSLPISSSAQVKKQQQQGSASVNGNENGNGKSSPSQSRSTSSSKKSSGNNASKKQAAVSAAPGKLAAQNLIQSTGIKKLAVQDASLAKSSSANSSPSGQFQQQQDERQGNSRIIPMDISQLERKIEELEQNQQQQHQQQQQVATASTSSGSSSTGEGSSALESVENQLDGLRAAIPGEPLMDYPIYSAPPRTSFDCMSQSCPGGYYADMETQCQVFHICQNDGRVDTFLCPNGTIFSQQHFVCVWWWQVDCQQSATFYKLNDGIYCNSVFPSSITSSSLSSFSETSSSSPSPLGSPAQQQTSSNQRRNKQEQTVANAGSGSSNAIPFSDPAFFDGVANDSREPSSPAFPIINKSFPSASSPADGSGGFSTTSSFSSSFPPSSSFYDGSAAQDSRAFVNNSNITKQTANENSQDLNQQQQQQLELLSRRA